MAPDTLPGSVLDEWLSAFPKEEERSIDMPTAEFLAWCVLTGRLEGDTLPPPFPSLLGAFIDLSAPHVDHGSIHDDGEPEDYGG